MPRAVPRIPSRYVPGLRGAAWSCDVDAMLNGADAWVPVGRCSFRWDPPDRKAA